MSVKKKVIIPLCGAGIPRYSDPQRPIVESMIPKVNGLSIPKMNL